MLVLSRKKHETIVIETPAGERIEVEVVEIQGHKVRLGVEADRSVIINRGEIQRLIDGRLTGHVRDESNQATAASEGSEAA